MGFDGDANKDGNIDNSSVIIKNNITLPMAKIGSYPSLTNYLILPSG